MRLISIPLDFSHKRININIIHNEIKKFPVVRGIQLISCRHCIIYTSGAVFERYMLVRAEVFLGRYRNCFENPEPFIPGQVAQVKYELPDVAHTFKKGHRIMIQVQNSWFQLVDRNPQKFVDIYHCNEEDFQKAMHRIYHDKQRASSLLVMILK